MKVQIVKTQENPLLKRKEVEFRIEQDQKSQTPARLEVRKAIAAKLETNENLVFIKKMQTLTGTHTTIGKATAYENDEQAKLIEPDYIMKRNSPPKQSKEGESE
jgi:ribosomal protein S24E